MSCPLCNPVSDLTLWQDSLCRVIRVSEPDYPGFCRVIWKAHVAEMTDLNHADRLRLMDVVFATEAALRRLMNPDKVNLASFGNVVPHLHWHVIPRFGDDRHFPEPVWGSPQRTSPARTAPPDGMIGREIARQLALQPQNGANG